MSKIDCDDVNAKVICHACVGEVFLRKEILDNGDLADCSYCGVSAHCYEISRIADRIETAFAQHFRRTSDQPNSWQYSALSDRESTYDWERDGEPVVDAILNAADISLTAAEDIQRVLEEKHSDFDAARMGDETDFSSESCYEKTSGQNAENEWGEKWHAFERSLKTEARFFSRSATADLKSVFEDIDRMSTGSSKPLVVNAGPGTTLNAVFRARVFQSQAKLLEAICRPDEHLGSPPAVFAVAGRMNARGISVFYGATEPGIAIAEVRPPVGSEVAVARFEIVSPLKLLDLTALSDVVEPGSIFDPIWTLRLDRANFLRSLSKRMTRPVMPDDEAFEYLPTQALADYLASVHEPPLDGIVFPSAQGAGTARNVVLFHKAARVATLQIPAGTVITAESGYHDGDGWEVDFTVSEEVPPANQGSTDAKLSTFPDIEYPKWQPQNEDMREVSLRVDTTAIKVHGVQRVEFFCEAHAVSRHRRVMSGLSKLKGSA